MGPGQNWTEVNYLKSVQWDAGSLAPSVLLDRSFLVSWPPLGNVDVVHGLWAEMPLGNKPCCRLQCAEFTALLNMLQGTFCQIPIPNHSGIYSTLLTLWKKWQKGFLLIVFLTLCGKGQLMELFVEFPAWFLLDDPVIKYLLRQQLHWKATQTCGEILYVTYENLTEYWVYGIHLNIAVMMHWEQQ